MEHPHTSLPSPAWKKWVYNLSFFLNGLLIFLLIFENRLVVPYWLQALGRAHPLVLHFPLAVLLMYMGWVLATGRKTAAHWHANLADTLLLIGTLSATLAAFSGFLLSKEGGYEAAILVPHKWLGVATALTSLVWYGFSNYLQPWLWYTKTFALAFVALLLGGGHLGGNLTHGEDFLISPLSGPAAENEKVAFEQARIYADLVQPVLQQKCYACHNAEKSKGGLQMHTEAMLRKGGKNGMLWDKSDADLGLMLRRIHLGIDDKKHMPPRGKTQLTDDEVMLLAEWVKGGSRFDQLVSALPVNNPAYAYAQNVLGGHRNDEQYDFEEADAEKIKSLNTSYRLIRPTATGSPALFVNFYNKSAFKSSDISELTPLKTQIVSMDLSKMPVKDEDLKTIATFTELRKLLLNFTDITGATLDQLSKLPKLRELSVSGTAIGLADLKKLEKSSIKTIYAWSTKLSDEEMVAFRQTSGIHFEGGFRGDSVVLALTPPIVENEGQILSGTQTIQMRHPIPGTVIRYTTDGTEPDSIRATIYSKPFSIDKNIKLNARAFKKDWYGSKPVEKPFFRLGFRIDSVRLMTQPDNKYKAKGGSTLSDGIKSDREANSGSWLGYRDGDFESYLYFNTPVEVSRVTLTMFQNIGGYIFPPVKIEIWGGTREGSMRLLKTIQPQKPAKSTKNVDDLIFEADIKPQTLGCLKIIAKPLAKLPDWHPGKGQKAWVFIDEVIVN